MILRLVFLGAQPPLVIPKKMQCWINRKYKMTVNPVTSYGAGYVLGLSEGNECLMPSVFLSQTLAVGPLGGFGAQLKSLFHGHPLR